MRTPAGEILLDFGGKISGRGAYICRKVDCLRKARKSRRIDRSLNVEIPADVYDRMESELSENE